MTSFSADTITGTFEIKDDQIIVNGQVHDNVKESMIKYIAAAPIERRFSYSGSGLPFANAQQAFENTKNQGFMELMRGNSFSFKIDLPNSYYAGLGTVLIPPTCYIVYNNGSDIKAIAIKLSNSIPYRMLTYPSTQTKPRADAMFYDGMYQLPVRTQEQILRDSAYPIDMKMAQNFWGLKPPV